MIQLNYRDAKPIYEQIKDGLRKLVITNSLIANEKLPSVRDLAADAAGRSEAAQALYRQIARTAPFTPICFKSWSVLTHWGKIAGLNPTQQNVFYGFSNWKPGR